jgi:hypothetical protein
MLHKRTRFDIRPSPLDVKHLWKPLQGAPVVQNTAAMRLLWQEALENFGRLILGCQNVDDHHEKRETQREHTQQPTGVFCG